MYNRYCYKVKKENMNNFQYNHFSSTVYQGKNQAELMSAKEKNNYKNDGWVTFLQAKQLGLKIKKGSHGEHVFNGYRETEVVNNKGKKDVEKRPMGWSTVFNLDQTEPIKTVN